MKNKLLTPILLFFIVSIFSYPFLFQGKLPIPADAIDGLYHPYRDFYAKEFPRGYPFKNFLITDPLRQQYPWREIALHSVFSFKLPFWNPYNGAGEPLLANIQSGTFYPFNVLMAIFPFQIGWSLLILLQPLLAGLFLYLYLIQLRLSKGASLVGGIIYAFCGFMTAWLEWGTIGQTALWLPLLLLSLDKIVKNKTHNLLLLQNKPLIMWSLIYLFSVSASLFAGHLQTFFYLYLLSLGYFLARWFHLKKSKKHLLFFLALTVGFFLLTIVQWLPTLQLINYSARDIDQIWQKDGWFVPWQHLIQFIAPDFFGNPSTQNYWGTWNYGEMVGYVGIGSLVIALYALFFRKDKKTLFFGTTFFFSLIFALPTFFAKLPFLWHIPFIATAQPTRLLFVADFSLAILAALGIDYYFRQEKKLQIIYPLVFVGLVFSLIWFYILKGHALTIPISPEYLTIAKHNLYLPTGMFAFIAVLFVGYALVANWLSSRKQQPGVLTQKNLAQVVLGIFILFTLFDLLRFSWKFNTFSQSLLLFPQTKIIRFLSDHSRTYPWRYMSTDYKILPPNISAHDRLYTVDTYNPLLLRRYQEFAAVSEWGFIDIPDFSFNRILILNNEKSKLIDFLGVKYIVSVKEMKSQKLHLLLREGETRVYENTNAFPRAFMTYNVLVLPDKKTIAKKMYDTKTDLQKTAIVETSLPIELSHLENIDNKVSINKYKENSIELQISTMHDGLLVLTDTFYPTWHVTIDKKEAKIYRTDYDFRGAIIPQGTHTVVFYNTLL